MRRISFALSFVAFVLLSGCDSDSPAPIAVTPPVLIPDLMVEMDFSKKFHYNAAGQLTQVKMVTQLVDGGTIESEQNFYYNASGRLTESTTDTGWRIVYFFTNDKISRSDEYVNGAASQYHTYTYNAANQLTETITWQNIPEEGGEIPVAKDTFEYDAEGSVVLHRLYYYTSFGAEAKLSTSFIMSDFDDKINSEDYFDVHPFNPLLTLSKHNAGKMEIQNKNGFITSRETYTFEYHPDGYPVKKKTDVVLFNGTTGSYETTYQFK